MENEEIMECLHSECSELSESTEPEPSENASETVPDTEYLEMKIRCMENGVRSDCIDDVIGLARVGGVSVESVTAKYPVMLDNSRISTGESMKSGEIVSDDKLRRAFGLE